MDEGWWNVLQHGWLTKGIKPYFQPLPEILAPTPVSRFSTCAEPKFNFAEWSSGVVITTKPLHQKLGCIQSKKPSRQVTSSSKRRLIFFPIIPLLGNNYLCIYFFSKVSQWSSFSLISWFIFSTNQMKDPNVMKFW